MQDSYTITPIARIRTPFADKFGIPRQSGLVEELRATIVFEEPFRNADALRGLEEYSHLWLIWQFSTVVAAGADGEHWRPTVRPPRLGGNTRMGVFATRSPFRPNALGLSCVKLLGVQPHTPDGPVIEVAGADLLDGTPIYDIKPYLAYGDCIPEAGAGYTSGLPERLLEVDLPERWLALVPQDRREALLGVLAHDPRPSYQRDPERVYGLSFAGLDVRFTVTGDVLTVCQIRPLNRAEEP